jgi:multidrug resistance efflux pump
MESLPVIPTPAGQKWREFRIRFLPLIVFCCTVAGICLIWTKNLVPPTLVAQVEGVSTPVRSSEAGIISNLYVQPFQQVHAGDVIAAVISGDNHQIDSKLQLLRNQISLFQIQLGNLVDQDRLAFNYQDYRLEYLRFDRDLDMAKAELPHAEFDMKLASNLLTEKIVSEFDYHTIASRVDVLKAEIKHLAGITLELKQKLEDSQSLGDFSQTSTNAAALKETLDRLTQERKNLETLQSSAILLTAPIDGVITSIEHRAGETVVAGDVIATISATDSDRIVGFIRQPFAFTPEPGMPVEIRTRSWDRAAGQSQIASVGAQFVVITNLAFVRPNLPPEVGLPLAISIPTELKHIVRPGELVDVTLQKK